MELLKQLQDIFIARVKNTLLMTFILSWCAVNYNVLLYIFFSNQTIEAKLIEISKNSLDWQYDIILPLLMTLFYEFVLPFINLKLNQVKHIFIEKNENELKNKKTLDYYNSMLEAEKARVQYKFIEKNAELDLKERENKIESDKLKIDTAKKSKDATVEFERNDTILAKPPAPIVSSMGNVDVSNTYPLTVTKLSVGDEVFEYGKDFDSKNTIVKLKKFLNMGEDLEVEFQSANPLKEREYFRVFDGVVNKKQKEQFSKIFKTSYDSSAFNVKIVGPSPVNDEEEIVLSNTVMFQF